MEKSININMIGQKTKYFEKCLGNIITTQLSEYCYSIALPTWNYAIGYLTYKRRYLCGSERGRVESGNNMLVIKMQMYYKKMSQIPDNVYKTVV